MKKILSFLVLVLVFLLVSCENGKDVIDEPKEPVFTTVYEVTYVDMYGEIIDKVMVKEGEDASKFTAPEVDYYTFTGWDVDLTNVKCDITTNALYSKNKEEYLMNDANYWLQLLTPKYNINKTILSLDEIKKYNENIASDYDKTKVVDVLSLDQKVTGEFVKTKIESYTNMNKYVVYNNETKAELSSIEKTQILNNRNLENVKDNIDVVYGIVTDFAWMRTYPTNNYSSTYDRDRFQETSLNVGEEVAIYHTSSDGLWYFVQSYNYYGWVEVSNIALSTYEEVSEFVNDENFLVVISDFVLIDNHHVRMGQKFPLVSTIDSYKIKFPTRNTLGNLELVEKELEKTDDYSVGYLEYNYKNLYNQMFKLLNIKYSWGDKEKDGRDCSSTQNSIYASFGFKLPRNTSNQNNVPTYGTSFSSITTSTLQENYLPGTLIFSSGHVMMYIGENAQGYAYLFHNTSAGQAKCILQRLSQYGVNKIIGTLKLQ